MMRRLLYMDGRMATGKFFNELRAWVQFDHEGGWSDFPAEGFRMLPQPVSTIYSLEAFDNYDASPWPEEPMTFFWTYRQDLGWFREYNVRKDSWVITNAPFALQYPGAVLWNLGMNLRLPQVLFSPYQMWCYGQGVKVIPIAQSRPITTNETTLGPIDLIEGLWELSPPSLSRLAKFCLTRNVGVKELLPLMGKTIQQLLEAQQP